MRIHQLDCLELEMEAVEVTHKGESLQAQHYYTLSLYVLIHPWMFTIHFPDIRMINIHMHGLLIRDISYVDVSHRLPDLLDIFEPQEFLRLLCLSKAPATSCSGGLPFIHISHSLSSCCFLTNLLG